MKNNVVALATEMLGNILSKSEIDKGHGIDHAKKVLTHAYYVMKDDKNFKDRDSILLASLLHDVDDRKFFPNNNDYDNARLILKEVAPEDENIVIDMIKLVSCSKNRDNVPEGTPSHYLIPRYCDRLEAIGNIGIERCLVYSKYTGFPLFTQETPLALNEKELREIATNERYSNYRGVSLSSLDHFYDKVLHILKNPTGYEYIDKLAAKRREEVIQFCININKGRSKYNELSFDSRTPTEFVAKYMSHKKKAWWRNFKLI